MSENRASTRTNSFSILTENNLNNTFLHVYDEVKNHNVKVDPSKIVLEVMSLQILTKILFSPIFNKNSFE